MKSSTVVTAITGLLIAAACCPPVAAQTCPPGIPRVAPDSRYIDHGDGTITDQQTGLMWKRCSEGLSGAACSGTANSVMTWVEALTAAADSSFAGYSDWRVPSVKELLSLVETGCHSPAINTNRFPNTFFEPPFPPAFWTSTSDPALLGELVEEDVFSVGFRNGGVGRAFKIDSSALLRLVRAGR